MTLVMGEGPIPCDTMIIGMNPGAEEEKQGRPFVGPSGKLLEEALEAAGLPRETVFITNVYKSRTPNNREPTEEEAEDHLWALNDEFFDIKPKFLLMLGSFAAKRIFGEHFKITKNRGDWSADDFFGIEYMATFHPSYLLHGKGHKEFYADIEEFASKVKEYRNGSA